MLYRCTEGCEVDIGMTKAREGLHRCEEHGAVLRYVKTLGREKKSPSRKGRSPLKRGRGFATSPAQQAKVRGLPCVVCGLDRFEAQIHAAHVYPRRLQSCECPEGVVPLCAADHERFDDPNESFDLLPALVGRGYHAELVHAVAVHGVPLVSLLEHVTGDIWYPAREAGRR